MTPGKRIKIARVASGYSQQLLANAISNYGDGKKVSRTAIAQWESGVTKEIEAANLLKAAKILNVTPEWLQFGVDNPISSLVINNSDMAPDHSKAARVIPIFNYLQAANYTTADKTHVSYAGIDEELAKVTGANVFALVVKGKSMEPGIKPGDIVIIDPDIKPQPGEIVLVALSNEADLLLRKYRPLQKEMTNIEMFELVALNEDWPKITVNNGEQGYIIGTLVEHRCRRRLPNLSNQDYKP